MLRVASKYFAAVPAVWIDGTLYVCIMLFGFLETRLGTDEAAKYMSPVVLWWTLTIIGALAAITGAIKLFRSTSYADHQQDKKEQAGISETTSTTITKTPPDTKI